MDSEEKLVLLCPEAVVAFREEKLVVTEKIGIVYDEEKCKVSIQDIHTFCQEGGTKYLDCNECHGKSHEGLEKSRPIKHPLHPKHLLILVRVGIGFTSRSCYCCARFILNYIYCCPRCDLIMNLGCVNKSAVSTIEHPKRHEHTLTLFASQASITCNVCALDHTNSPIYICPPCGFVVHKRCIDLPWVIRISRHHHRISFTPSFVLEDLFCGICRKKIDCDYGGYSCNKEGCSYAAHSRCATRKNVWDGEELEGVPEDVEEEVEPFERISDGIILHFCHENHHLRLHDEDSDRVYDESKYCHMCSTPIYYGNLYSCMQCDFILHETCANLPRTKYHAIHPHLLTLVVQEHDGRRTLSSFRCSACNQTCDGFFYQCSKKGCSFKVHVQCTTISEPLIHESHIHPLFLTSEPGERRNCKICKETENISFSSDTFNCIECDFVLCLRCAVLPHKVRYKHDKHILTLSYGEETSPMKNWCEVCETKIDTCKRFYTCEECCVTIHIECLLGKILFMKPGSYVFLTNKTLDVLLNNRMTRPMCEQCHKRCQDNLIFQFGASTFCLSGCLWNFILQVSLGLKEDTSGYKNLN